jgi:hypothetical protein
MLVATGSPQQPTAACIPEGGALAITGSPQQPVVGHAPAVPQQPLTTGRVMPCTKPPCAVWVCSDMMVSFSHTWLIPWPCPSRQGHGMALTIVHLERCKSLQKDAPARHRSHSRTGLSTGLPRFPSPSNTALLGAAVAAGLVVDQMASAIKLKVAAIEQRLLEFLARAAHGISLPKGRARNAWRSLAVSCRDTQPATAPRGLPAAGS